jgi:hypothetical protein
MAEIAETECIKHNLYYRLLSTVGRDNLEFWKLHIYRRYDCEGRTCEAFFS